MRACADLGRGNIGCVCREMRISARSLLGMESGTDCDVLTGAQRLGGSADLLPTSAYQSSREPDCCTSSLRRPPRRPTLCAFPLAWSESRRQCLREHLEWVFAGTRAGMTVSLLCTGARAQVHCATLWRVVNVPVISLFTTRGVLSSRCVGICRRWRNRCRGSGL
jgi:hypothetical protein